MNLVFLDFRGCIVGKVIGDFDVLSADIIKARFQLLLRQGRHSMVMDLSEVHYIDSAGIGALVSINTWLERYGRKLNLYKPTPPVEKLLDSMGVNLDAMLIHDLDLVEGESEEEIAEWRQGRVILLLGADKGSNERMAQLLREEGYGKVEAVRDPNEALEVVGREDVHLIAIDLALDQDLALGLSQGLLDSGSKIPVIHTGFDVQNGKPGTNRRQSFLTLVSSGLQSEELGLEDLFGPEE